MIFINKFKPENLYLELISGKRKTALYSVPVQVETLISGDSLELDPPEYNLNASLWQSFHFNAYNIPLPVHHPYFSTIPILKYDKDTHGSEMGMLYETQSGVAILSLYFNQDRSFSKAAGKHTLFDIPYVKNLLHKKNLDTVWGDLFTHNTKIKEDTKTKLDDLLYNLYILDLRSRFLPSWFHKFAFYKKQNLAVIETDYPNKDYKEEFFYQLQGDIVKSYRVVYLVHHKVAEALRFKILNELHFTQTTEEDSQILYKEFKQLPYYKQIDEEGRLYLLAAFSHKNDDPIFLKEMVPLLEKGKNNFRQLRPLYDYAYARFGSNYSQDKRFLQEEGREELRRKIELEKLKEKQEAEKKNSSSMPEHFESTDEQIKTYLKAAKDKQGDDSENDRNGSLEIQELEKNSTEQKTLRNAQD